MMFPCVTNVSFQFFPQELEQKVIGFLGFNDKNICELVNSIWKHRINSDETYNKEKSRCIKSAIPLFGCLPKVLVKALGGPRSFFHLSHFDFQPLKNNPISKYYISRRLIGVALKIKCYFKLDYDSNLNKFERIALLMLFSANDYQCVNIGHAFATRLLKGDMVYTTLIQNKLKKRQTLESEVLLKKILYLIENKTLVTKESHWIDVGKSMIPGGNKVSESFKRALDEEKEERNELVFVLDEL